MDLETGSQIIALGESPLPLGIELILRMITSEDIPQTPIWLVDDHVLRDTMYLPH
jgi:hypothetical protein